MSKKVFSAEEMASLAANPYTSRVTAKQITFTKEFKERFWVEYCGGKTPSEIVTGCGYNVETLGERRIGGIREHIRKESANPEGFQGEREKDAEKPNVIYLRFSVRLPINFSMAYPLKMDENRASGHVFLFTFSR